MAQRAPDFLKLLTVTLTINSNEFSVNYEVQLVVLCKSMLERQSSRLSVVDCN